MPRAPSPPSPSAPARLTLHTATLTPAQMERLEEWCDGKNLQFQTVEHARFAFRNEAEGFNLVGYKSGKLVVQGKGTQDFVEHVLEPQILGEARLGYDEVHHPDWFEPHAGLDEAGKGDLFGPLVTACVVADGAAVRVWLAAGLKDSKALQDRTVLKLDQLVRQTPGVAVATMSVGMLRYNELMARPRANLNRLLAWQHAKTLTEALAQRRVPWGLLDQFSTQPLVQKYFKDETFDLRMRPKAESDPVVAAASVVARAEFVRRMQALSAEYGAELPKGASAHVKQTGRELVDKLGKAALGHFAKLHFRTAYEVLGLPVPEKKPWSHRSGKSTANDHAD